MYNTDKEIVYDIIRLTADIINNQEILVTKKKQAYFLTKKNVEYISEIRIFLMVGLNTGVEKAVFQLFLVLLVNIYILKYNIVIVIRMKTIYKAI